MPMALPRLPLPAPLLALSVFLCAVLAAPLPASFAAGVSPRAGAAGPEMARAGARFEICYNYGCRHEQTVVIDSGQLERVRRKLARAGDASAERAALAEVLGWLYRGAATQTPVGSDRGGNLLDGGSDGRMDCIDHSISTTRMLRLLEARGWLHFHRVLPRARRSRLIFEHFSAVIEELPPPVQAPAEPEIPDHVATLLALCDCPDVVLDIPTEARVEMPASVGTHYAVDSWFVDNGEPAVVLPLAEWLNGGGPNVQ